MTIASKTDLLGFRFVRAGSPYAMVAAKTTIDATEFDYVYQGAPFYGVSNETTPNWPSIPAYVRLGNTYNESTAKSTIDASEFDYIRQGAPFWVKYIAPEPPSGYNATQFFMVF